MESILMMVIVIGVFYFILIRPENKRKKQAQEMRDSVKKGDTITTIGGIIGRVVFVTGNTIVIETSEDRVRMELAKWAISTTGVQINEQPDNAKKKKEDEEVSGEIPAPENKEDK
ncbi:MAG: preprotein translocase subunit YajC [Oscillibacter sp.]|nr:preprotein translocase subunit YajC [Oscillibacter sp.]